MVRAGRHIDGQYKKSALPQSYDGDKTVARIVPPWEGSVLGALASR